MYMQNNFDCVTSITRLFADDCLLYRIVSSAEDAAKFQQDLINLQKWEDDWLMSFNPDKCKILRVTKSRRLIQQPTPFVVRN